MALGQTFILGHGSARLLVRGGSKLVDEAEAVRWLRRSYRYAAFVDAIAAVGMVHPKLYEPTLRFDRRFRRTGPEFTYAMRTGAPLMAGWTVLLLWADRKPLERRGVLLITLLPVVAGTMANDASAVRAGRLSGGSVAPVRALQLFLVGLCGYSLARARAGCACASRVTLAGLWDPPGRQETVAG